MAKRSLTGSRVVLTGASSGIGYALALELVRRGALVLTVARRQTQLEQLKAAADGPGRVEILIADITDYADRQRIISAAQEHFGGLDILINNAGVGALGLFEYADEARLRQIMEVNFFALAEMIRQALPLLKSGNNPLVVNVSSVLGHRAIPRMSEYSASKFAVQGFSDSLRSEFVRLGIDVLVVSPGSTESEFFDNMVETKGEVLWANRPRRTAARVALNIADAIERGRREIIPSHSGRLLVWLNRLVPGIVDHFLAQRT